MNAKGTKANVLSSLFWKLMERGGTQGIQFGVQVVLARLLLPEEYGIIAIVMVFILLANVFVQSGFNTALIQKKEVDEVDFSSVLYLSLVVATLIYLIVYCLAPSISNFYQQPLLTPVLRVLSITLFLGAFNSIQNAFIARNMLFKKLFFSSLAATITSGVAGIMAAYSGWGVWSLVLQHLTNQIVIAIILWFTISWRPHFIFSLLRIKGLFRFGSKILASTLIDTLYRDLRTLIIGRIYAPAMLGYFNRGRQFPEYIVSNIDGSIQSVMLPALAEQQDNPKRLKEMVRRSIVTSSFLIFPMMIGLAVVAEPLVKIVLTEKWLPSVPFLQMFCLSYALRPIHASNLQAINAMGRSDIFLKIEIIKKIIGLSVLAISLPFGIYAIALSMVANGFIASFINAYPNKELLGYSYKEQLIDVVPSLVISVIMGGLVYFLNYLTASPGLLLIIQIFSGAIIYFVLAKIFKIESFSYLVSTVKLLLKSRKEASV